MKHTYKYGNKTINLRPYTTIIEKDILIYGTVEKNLDIDKVLEILEDYHDADISLMSETEKKALLYNLRIISVGEYVPILFKCMHCGAPNEVNIDISEMIETSNCERSDEYDELLTDYYDNVSEDNFDKFINIDVDELSFDEYDNLYEYVKQVSVKFNFLYSRACITCKEPNLIDISNNSNVVENMSEDTLMSIYQTINDLVFFSHYTKEDVDNMLPFERSIFIGLLNKTREELAK